MAEQIRRAASVIAGRDGDGGLELLVLERSAASRFLPGYVAFPGGAVDDDDAALAAAWWGDPEEAGRACALRELAEEAGLVLGDDGDERPLAVDRLVEIAHWIAPEQVPVRFDARYYAVAMPTGVEPVPDGGETAAAWWESPSTILDGWRAKERKLYWPTYFTMLHLATCRSIDELLALRIETREPDDEELERLPRDVFWQD
ncbi:MAG TPA: NUDIX domain-containing protein [Actinomycetota bacterium]